MTCEDLVRHCHATAVAGEDVWNLRAFSRLTAWQDLQEAAKAADDRRRNGQPKSLLDGIPISIKGNLAVNNQCLTAGSRILGEGSIAGGGGAIGYNAEIVQQFVDDCGAICIGITTMDEFGMGSLGTNQVLQGVGGENGATKNPLSFLTNTSCSNGDAAGSSDRPNLLSILQQSQEDILVAHQAHIGTSHHDDNDNNNSSSITEYYAAGGSSCGAAASVAHGSSLVALASDTGGSIRLPAAWCGVVGLKPSYGRVSRHGLVSYASSLDTVGFMTPTVECASLVLEELNSIKGASIPPEDPTHHFYHRNGQAEEDTTKATISTSHKNNEERPLEGIKIGIPAAFVVEECPDAVKEMWTQGAATLEQAGATLVTLSSDVMSPDVIQQSLAAYYVLASAEASSNLARYDGFRYGVAAADSNSEKNQEPTTKMEEGTALQQQYAKTRSQGFGAEVVRRILCGTAVLSSDKFHTHYEAAAKLRALVTDQLHGALKEHVDYMLIPTVVSPPPRLHQKAATITDNDNGDRKVDHTEMFGNDIMTVPISLAGLAAVNVPFELSKNSDQIAGSAHPVEVLMGLQLVGPRLKEEDLLFVAQHLERNG